MRQAAAGRGWWLTLHQPGSQGLGGGPISSHQQEVVHQAQQGAAGCCGVGWGGRGALPLPLPSLAAPSQPLLLLPLLHLLVRLLPHPRAAS